MLAGVWQPVDQPACLPAPPGASLLPLAAERWWGFGPPTLRPTTCWGGSSQTWASCEQAAPACLRRILPSFHPPCSRASPLLPLIMHRTCRVGCRRYDSSLKGEDLFGTGAVLRAGRLNGSFHPNCVHSRSSCDGWAGLPFWEVPAYMPPGHGDHRSDPEPVDGMSIMQVGGGNRAAGLPAGPLGGKAAQEAVPGFPELPCRPPGVPRQARLGCCRNARCCPSGPSAHGPPALPPSGAVNRLLRVAAPPPVPALVLQRYQADFERKRGTGIPVAVLVHAPYIRL